jgi:hypothetical protein
LGRESIFIELSWPANGETGSKLYSKIVEVVKQCVFIQVLLCSDCRSIPNELSMRPQWRQESDPLFNEDVSSTEHFCVEASFIIHAIL